MHSSAGSIGEGTMFLGCPLVPYFRLSGHIVTIIFHKIDIEYSLAPTDDLIRFRRSKVKVTAGQGTHVGSEASSSTL